MITTFDDLDVQIGQMLLVGFRGLEIQPEHPIISDIRERHIGGVILFDYDVPLKQPSRNIQSPEQVKRLTTDLQNLAEIPLLIGIDQEGGKVNRLKERFGFPPTVTAQYLGALNQPETTKIHAERTAQTLAELGVNLNFAPVVDLNINPDSPAIGHFERSFSADPEHVATHALEWIRAHHRQNILCTLKHFPGHGSSNADSHLGWVDVSATWSSQELTPYAAIIQTGECDLIMTAHIFNAALDPQFPATLSHAIITGILRDQLHYDGVVISDDMQMKAISAHYSLETALQLAINAGIDILTFGNNLAHDPTLPARAVSIIKQLVKDGAVSRERIAQSYQRIRRLKTRFSV